MKHIFSIPALLLSLLFLVCVHPHPVNAKNRVYLDITSPETRKINFAVPWFVNKGLDNQPQKLGSEMADTLAKALKFHGIISIIPTSSFGGMQTAEWKKYKADYTVLAQYSINAKSLVLELRLLDVATGEFVMGKSYRGTMDQKNEMIFKFCDSVIKELTGYEGMSNSKIAFVAQKNNTKEVFLTDILGRKLRQISRHKNLVVSPRFTPDGNYLSYTSYHSGNQNLYITDLRQSKTTRVLSRRKGMNLAPAWSPDGKRMVLTLSKHGNPDLYLLDRKGRILEQLTKRQGINVSATWSPDGKKIAFVSDRYGSPQIFTMDMATRKVDRITYEGSENAEPCWSPTENLITYSSLRKGVYQIYMMKPVKGARPIQVTKDLSHHEAPSWSPDGNQIIFSKRDGRDNKIYAILKNGSYQRRVFTAPNFPKNQSYPQWIRK